MADYGQYQALRAHRLLRRRHAAHSNTHEVFFAPLAGDPETAAIERFR